MVDVYPISFAILIHDDQRVKLLNSTVEENWYKEQFKAEFEGMICDADWDVGMKYIEPVQSRACPHALCLYSYPSIGKGKYIWLPSAFMSGEFESIGSCDVDIKFLVPELEQTYDIKLK